MHSIICFLEPLYQKLFPSWVAHLKKELSNCETVLDLGCGYNSPIQFCKISKSVGVELFEPYLEESKKKAIHSEYIHADIRKLEFKPKSFDAVFASEVLEHMTKQEGFELLSKIEGWAIKKVIITTPNGYVWQDGYDENTLQVHKCGWNPSELKKLGYQVYGMNGWKKLRGYQGSLKYKPVFLWARISDLSQKITYYWPKMAFQLFAVKNITSG
jgi:SAM-dependent methyltransferase